MTPPIPHRRCGTPSIAGFLTLGILAPPLAVGQGIGFLEEPRVGGKYERRLDREIREERQEASREGFSVSVIASLAYDDNIFQTAKDAKEDFVAQVSPRVAYTKGQRTGRAWVSLAYEGTAVAYLGDRGENRVDHLVTAEASLRKKALVFAYSGSWAKLGTPSADVGGATKRTEWRNRASLGWEPRSRTSAELFAEWSRVDQEESSLFDIKERMAGVAVRYRYSPKTLMELAWRMGEVDVEGADTQDVQRFTGQVRWQPRPKIGLNVEVGGEYRDYGTRTDWSPVFAARLNWSPRGGTDLYLEGYRREEASAYSGGENYTVKGVKAGVSQRLRGAWTGGLEAGHETSDYFDVTGTGSADRKDRITFIRPSLEYRFQEGYELKFFYQWAENDSSEPDFGYTNQEMGVTMNYTF
jgi:hypothetical protein